MFPVLYRLKHQGSKERYIRDLYKTGNMAKHEKAKAEAEMARVDACPLHTPLRPPSRQPDKPS
jgi:hypothetical protein